MTSIDESTTASGAPEASASSKSALQDNIERKGKNAYYFAHAHKASGPKWDGKAEPKLLSKSVTPTNGSGNNKSVLTSSSSFDYTKSNITTYAFLDEPSKVKLYIELEGIGQQCQEEDVSLTHTESSFSLVINNYTPPPTATKLQQLSSPCCLSFGKLTGSITNASYKIKENRIILTLAKEKHDVEWHTINDKGAPDHEVV